MSELSEEEIARAIRDAQHMPPSCDYPQCECSYDCEREALSVATYALAARAVLALLQPALERAREALTDEQDHLLMCAIENLRSAERNDRTVEAAWRMAEKMEAWRKAAAIRKG